MLTAYIINSFNQHKGISLALLTKALRANGPIFLFSFSRPPRIKTVDDAWIIKTVYQITKTSLALLAKVLITWPPASSEQWAAQNKEVENSAQRYILKHTGMSLELLTKVVITGPPALAYLDSGPPKIRTVEHSCSVIYH